MARVTKVGIFGGIDPGKEGGFAVISGGKVLVYPMPDTMLEIAATIEELFRSATHVFLEKVASSQQMGVKSAFTFGQNFGALEACLAAIRVPYSLVPPQRWQSGMGVPNAKSNPRVKKMKPHQIKAIHKENLRAMAQRLFPKLELWSKPKTVVLQRCVADALLMAQYCQLCHR